MSSSSNIKRYWFVASDGFPLYSEDWSSSLKSKAHIVFLQGISDYIQRYKETFTKFLNEGFSVTSFDYRGNGYTHFFPEEMRALADQNDMPVERNPALEKKQIAGHIETMTRMYSDISEIIIYVEKVYKPDHIVLVGQSAGALIALGYVNKFSSSSVDCVVASSPALGRQINEDLVKPLILKVLNFNFILRKTYSYESYNQYITRDRDETKKLLEDPYIHKHASLATTKECQILRTDLKLNTPNIHIPVLIGHGSDDHIDEAKISDYYFRKLAKNNSKNDLIIYPGAYHHLFSELNRDQVLNDYINWIKKVIN